MWGVYHEKKMPGVGEATQRTHRSSSFQHLSWPSVHLSSLSTSTPSCRHILRLQALLKHLTAPHCRPQFAMAFPDLKDRPVKETICLFDVDNTLSPARQAATPEMLDMLLRLRQKCAIGYVKSTPSSPQLHPSTIQEPLLTPHSGRRLRPNKTTRTTRHPVHSRHNPLRLLLPRERPDSLPPRPTPRLNIIPPAPRRSKLPKARKVLPEVHLSTRRPTGHARHIHRVPQRHDQRLPRRPKREHGRERRIPGLGCTVWVSHEIRRDAAERVRGSRAYV